jgi:uncharacterized protein YidB (DUF937 family)
MSAPRASVFDPLTTDARPADPLDQRLLADFAERLAPKTDGDALAALAQANPLQMLLEDFRAANYQDDVRAWLAPGQAASPPPLPPDAITAVAAKGRVIDKAWLEAEAARYNVDVDTVTRRLAALIPSVIKVLTPRGEVPTPRALLIGVDGLRRRPVR